MDELREIIKYIKNKKRWGDNDPSIEERLDRIERMLFYFIQDQYEDGTFTTNFEEFESESN